MSAGAVVTGMGVIAPTGIGVAEHWANTVTGRCAIAPVTRFDASGYNSGLAGEVPGFVPSEHLPSRLVAQTDHMTRLALVAAKAALADADLDTRKMADFGVGVVTAATAGGFEFGHRELHKLWSKGPEHVSAYQSFAWFYAVNSGQISIRHGLRGPSGVLVSGDAGSLDAVGQARRHIGDGVQAMLTGGVDGSLCPWGWVAQLASKQVSRSQDPAQAYLPFDVGAAGSVPGEGGAILVLESPRSARRRGAKCYGEVSGYAATFDPAPGSGRPSTLQRAAEGALADAGMSPAEVDVVFADASGVPVLDAVEAAALRAIFGAGGVPVTAPKSMTGRLGAGGAALDIATALLAIGNDVIPPTANVCQPLPKYGLDLVLTARESPLRTALVLARGYGGFNAAMVLTSASKTR
jgi:act minimal PKS chain-length factor (CLF/KS beta)